MGRWKKPHRDRLAAACPERVAADPNMVNVYRCACGWELVTIDLHQGTTWMLETCRACGGTARSTFYSDAARGKTPTHEWYMPTPAEFVKLHPLKREHCAKGGLLLRKRVALQITEKKPADGGGA